MAFSLLFLSIFTLMFSASAFPFLEPPPLPLPEQNSELPASPVSAPAALPAAGIQNQPVGQQQQNPVLPATPGQAAVPAVAAPIGGANQQPSGGPEQDQQQPLDGSVSGGITDQEAEPEQGNLQPTGAGVQPVGFGQAGQQQQQAVGFGTQPLVDNTPFDSGSSRMGMGSSRSWFGCAYALALAWFLMV